MKFETTTSIYDADALAILRTTDWLAVILAQPQRARQARKEALRTLGCTGEELLEALKLLQVAFIVRKGEVWWELPSSAVPLRAVA